MVSAPEYRLYARRCRREGLRKTRRFRRAKPLPGGNDYRPAHWGLKEWRNMARFWMRCAKEEHERA